MRWNAVEESKLSLVISWRILMLLLYTTVTLDTRFEICPNSLSHSACNFFVILNIGTSPLRSWAISGRHLSFIGNKHFNGHDSYNHFLVVVFLWQMSSAAFCFVFDWCFIGKTVKQTFWLTHWLWSSHWLTGCVIAPASLPGQVWHAVIIRSYY